MAGFDCGGIWVLLCWVGPCSVNPESNFLLLCGAAFPLCSLPCEQTMAGIMEVMETSFQRTYASTVVFSVRDSTAGNC